MAKLSKTWSVGDPVSVDHDGRWFDGVITSVDEHYVSVVSDDGKHRLHATVRELVCREDRERQVVERERAAAREARIKDQADAMYALLERVASDPGVSNDIAREAMRIRDRIEATE